VAVRLHCNYLWRIMFSIQKVKSQYVEIPLSQHTNNCAL
jgi:hypothetical protein